MNQSLMANRDGLTDVLKYGSTTGSDVDTKCAMTHLDVVTVNRKFQQLRTLTIRLITCTHVSSLHPFCLQPNAAHPRQGRRRTGEMHAHIWAQEGVSKHASRQARQSASTPVGASRGWGRPARHPERSHTDQNGTDPERSGSSSL